MSLQESKLMLYLHNDNSATIRLSLGHSPHKE